MTEYFELGRILKPQGIKGEIKLSAYTDDLSRFDTLDFVFFQEAGNYIRVEVESARVDAHFAYLKLQGSCNRDAAEKLRGKTIYVDRAHAAELPEGAYYIKDLLGCKVLDSNGTELGILKDIMQTGAADIYVVRTAEGGQCMFPSVKHVVLTRDVGKKIITVDAERLSEVAVYDL